MTNQYYLPKPVLILHTNISVENSPKQKSKQKITLQYLKVELIKQTVKMKSQCKFMQILKMMKVNIYLKEIL